MQIKKPEKHPSRCSCDFCFCFCTPTLVVFPPVCVCFSGRRGRWRSLRLHPLRVVTVTNNPTVPPKSKQFPKKKKKSVGEWILAFYHVCCFFPVFTVCIRKTAALCLRVWPRPREEGLLCGLLILLRCVYLTPCLSPSGLVLLCLRGPKLLLERWLISEFNSPLFPPCSGYMQNDCFMGTSVDPPPLFLKAFCVFSFYFFEQIHLFQVAGLNWNSAWSNEAVNPPLPGATAQSAVVQNYQ